MGTAKVRSGSAVGKVKYPYDAMVYIDGTTVIAVDSEGNTIKRGTAGTDDSEVIQAAVTNIGDNQGVVYLNSKDTFTITNAIESNGKISLVSHGAYIDLTSFDGTFFKVNNTAGQVVYEHVAIEGLNIVGSLTNTNTVAIHVFRRPWNVVIRDVIIKFVSYPIKVEGECYGININHCFISSCINAITFLEGSGADMSNFSTVTECNIGSASQYGIDCTGIGYGSFITNNYFEGNLTGIYYNVSPQRNTMSGNFISVSSSGVGIECVGPGLVIGNMFTTVGNSICIKLSGTASSGTYDIKDNTAQLYDDSQFIVGPSNKGYVANVTGNTVSPTGGSTLSNYYISVQFVQSVVSNNILLGTSTSSGIYAYSSAPYSSYNIISNNLLRDFDTGITSSLSTACNGNYFYNVKVPMSKTWNSSLVSANNFGYAHISEVYDSIGAILDIFGDPRLLCVCFQISGTSVSDYTRRSNTLTAVAPVEDWCGYQKKSPYYNFNGTSHYLYRANDTDFNFGNSLTDSAFSLVVAINPDNVTSRQIIGKWDVNNLREWRLFLDASGYPTLQLYDESVDKYIGRQDQTAFTTGSWKILITTYDGSGICAGCKIYIDGVQLDDADYTDAGYVAMEAINTNLMVGALKNAAAYSEYFDGKMTWISVAAKELSIDEVWSLTQRLKGALGI
jgi:hypothetical protein